MRNLATIALLALPCAAGLAQPSFDPEPDPLYHIEIIVYALGDGDRSEEDFRHGQPDLTAAPEPQLYPLPMLELESVLDLEVLTELDTATEVPPELLPDPAPAVTAAGLGDGTDAGFDGLPAAGDRLELFATRPGDPASAADSSLPDGFRILRRDELELTGERNTLRRSRGYTVLGHAGWVQAGVDTDRSVALDLKWLGITNPTGTIEIYLRRFLHAVVDFEFFDGNGTRWTSAGGPGLAPFRYAESYRLQDERNAIRSGEFHLFDHPLFGVLIQITPAPDPETEAGERPAG